MEDLMREWDRLDSEIDVEICRLLGVPTQPRANLPIEDRQRVWKPANKKAHINRLYNELNRVIAASSGTRFSDPDQA